MDFVCVCKYNWILIILRACISSFQLSLSVSAWLWNVNLALCIMLCLMSSAGTPDFCFNVNRNIHKTFDQLLQVACCLSLKNYTIYHYSVTPMTICTNIFKLFKTLLQNIFWCMEMRNFEIVSLFYCNVCLCFYRKAKRTFWHHLKCG